MMPDENNPAVLICSEALAGLRALPDESVHCWITSPPYWGLRDYKTGRWDGGDPDCDHEVRRDGHGPKQSSASASGHASKADTLSRTRCRCGAVRVDDLQLGLEPDPEQYIARLVEILREARRVLRSDGLLWLNLGDSYVSKSQKGNLAPKNLVGMPWRVAMALQADGWCWRQWLPWIKRNCLSGGAIVYVRCQKGVMPMMIKDLAKLDPTSIQLWNGTRWTQMVSIWPAESRNGAIEIELRSGERIGCTPEHRWPTSRGLLNASDLAIGDCLVSATLPDSESESPDLIPDHVGWLIGLFLAEGSRQIRGCRFSLSAKETSLEERIRRYAVAYGATCRAHIYGNTMHVVVHGRAFAGLINSYVAGEGSYRKHLTNACWRRSNVFLRELLDGYLAGDGHWDQGNRRWRLGFCSNDALAQDIRTLAGRLGFSLRLKRARMMCKDKVFPGWRGQIRLEPPIPVPAGGFSRMVDTEIVAIRPSRARQFWDIAVADDPHLFSLASGVLTHNSMPESCKDRPSSACEAVLLLAKSETYFYDREAVRMPVAPSVIHDRPHDGKKVARCFPGAQQHGGGLLGDGQLRSFRNSDFFWSTWQGLLHDEDDNPVALVVNVVPYKGAHFATFPPELVRPMILASTSERGVCPECGAPWRRVTKRERRATRPGTNSKVYGPDREHNPVLADGPDREQAAGKVYCPDRDKKQDAVGKSTYVGFNSRVKNARVESAREIGNRDPLRHVTEVRTLGWEPGCDCPYHEPIPATVGDPFAGSGTTLEVSVTLKRRGLGIELNPDFIELAKKRLADPIGVGGLFHSDPIPVVMPTTLFDHGNLE